MKYEIVLSLAKDARECEFLTSAKLLEVLAYIIKQAQNTNNNGVWFIKEDIGHGDIIKGICIENINFLDGMILELGTDYKPKEALKVMQECTKNEDGYCLEVLTTHDLYSAEIPNLSELMYRLMMINA